MNPQDYRQRMELILSDIHQRGRLTAGNVRGELIQADIDEALDALMEVMVELIGEDEPETLGHEASTCAACNALIRNPLRAELRAKLSAHKGMEE